MVTQYKVLGVGVHGVYVGHHTVDKHSYTLATKIKQNPTLKFIYVNVSKI